MSVRLPTRSVIKPWGKTNLPAPFTSNAAGEAVGEIWFEPPPQMPDLLVKYIFTSEKLSVQVHPSDVQTKAMGLGLQGKEECWLVLDAAPGAVLGVGFDTPISPDALRRAALDGSIEDLLTWHPVQAGDFFYIPANTVHAIGAGISLIEVQQTSDITYRLYDYGRPRDLHLDEAIAVAQAGPYCASWRKQLVPCKEVALVDGPYFRLDRVYGRPSDTLLKHYEGPALVIPLDVRVGAAGQFIGAGDCGLVEDLSLVDFPAEGYCLIAQSTQR